MAVIDASVVSNNRAVGQALLGAVMLFAMTRLPANAQPGQVDTKCNRECFAENCSQFTNEEKLLRAECSRKCRAQCTKPPPVKVIRPRYFIMAIVYAPPGCTSTATLKCAATSLVDYAQTSSNGTKLSTKSAFKIGMSVSVNAKLPVGPLDASTGFTVSQTDSTSRTISKSQTLGIKVSGNADGVDHGQDQFVLLLNPAIAVNVQGNNVTWNVGHTGPSALLFTVFASELKDPSTMRPPVARQLQTLGFTNEDFQTILSADPFAANLPIDPKRYVPTTWTFPYEPALASADCNGGVCSCISFTQALKNDFQTEKATESSLELSISLSTGAGLSDILSVKQANTFTTTNSSSRANTTGSSQSATTTVVCPSTTYDGPVFMEVNWDTIYGSFVFVPLELAAKATVHQGKIMEGSGKPARGQLVDLTLGGRTFHTFTDRNGGYRFVVGKKEVGGLRRHGTLTVKGKKQRVRLFSNKPTVIRTQ
ncbi:MAG TPA: hypothetical protein VF121_04675 [Thermoanaerobaculia bacterium]|nr:hypothetical protein [Thermoanaerobaculia bacterium]